MNATAEATETAKPAFDQFAILEVMGKTRLGGRVREEHVFGVPMIRIDIPDGKGGFVMTRYFHPQALFGVTPVGEKEATAVAMRNTAPPVYRWEMAEQKLLGDGAVADAEYPDPDDDDDDDQESFTGEDEF
jgi:hypothetical protein